MVDDSGLVVPRLHSLFCPRIPELDTYEPPDPTNFAVPVQAFIGHTAASDSFDFVVCTPTWLVDEIAGVQHDDYSLRLGLPVVFPPGFDIQLPPDDQPIETPDTFDGWGLVFQPRWSYDNLWAYVERVCADAATSTWPKAAYQIGQRLPWEFAYRYLT